MNVAVRSAFEENDFCFADDDQEGVMDNLMEALKTGSAFNVSRDKRGEKNRNPRAAGGKSHS